MENMRNADDAVADEVERFIREIGQVADDDADFTRQVHLHHSGYLDSHGVVQLIVHLEEKFQIELNREKISDPAFVNIDGISTIVTATLQERAGWPGEISPPGSHRTRYVEFDITGCMSKTRLC